MKRKRFVFVFKKNTKSDLNEQKQKEIKSIQAEVHNTLLESIKRLEN